MRCIFSWQSIDKPGSVVNDHLSSSVVAYTVKRISACGRVVPYADLLAADRVYLCDASPHHTVGSYPTRFIFSLLQVVSFLWHFP